MAFEEMKNEEREIAFDSMNMRNYAGGPPPQNRSMNMNRNINSRSMRNRSNNFHFFNLIKKVESDEDEEECEERMFESNQTDAMFDMNMNDYQTAVKERRNVFEVTINILISLFKLSNSSVSRKWRKPRNMLKLITLV